MMTDARKQAIVDMWEKLTLEQRADMLHLARLMRLRNEVDAEIAAIQEAAEDGRTLPAPTVH